MIYTRKRWLVVAIALVATFLLWRSWSSPRGQPSLQIALPEPGADYLWRRIKQHYPKDSFRVLPVKPRSDLPKVQAKFNTVSSAEKSTCLLRQKAIKNAFIKAWNLYQKHAWLHDEVTPISGQYRDTFGGWGATLIDSLDTLWIMDMKKEFAVAVESVHQKISFEMTAAQEINVFETTIRFLGGLLSAYDMSGDWRLLSKARDVGDMLYKAYDTPNHLPVTRWDIHAAAKGNKQIAGDFILIAEIGSLSMEFTRLSLLTGEPKYYDAVQHISELLAESQMKSKIPGMWSIVVDAQKERFDVGDDYSLGGMSDSVYEYLPKMVAVLGDADSIYANMYTQSMEAARRHLFYRPMTPESDDILLPGVAHIIQTDGRIESRIETSAGHLGCFAGGMLALGGRLMSNETHVEWGDRLTRGCIWGYKSMSTGVMPEVFHVQSCPSLEPCQWDESKWHEGIISKTSSADVERTIKDQRLPRGFTKISDARYILRPEAIESVFIMYRITGDSYWRERAWEMWTAIDKMTWTELANSAVWDVNPKEGEEAPKSDMMESFWLGETLKYFYLIFSEPDLVSLDDWVFNTEAHPFRRRKST